MVEVVLLPEMLQAGVEALVEAEKRGLDDENTAIAIYLAMRAIEHIYSMNERGMVH